MNKYIKLIICIIIPQTIGGLSGIVTTKGTVQWYPDLIKPILTPPNWIFAPVWIILYFLMGIASFLIWNQGLKSQKVKNALILFIIQLLLNGLWSILFFGLRSPILGLIDIILLWIIILITIIYFFKLSRIAGGLLIPYILWVSFAIYLNVSIWYLNC